MTDEGQDIAPVGGDDETSGDRTVPEVFGNEDDARSTAHLIAHFVVAWNGRKQAEPPEVWLADELRRFPGIWNGEQEIESAARKIVASIDQANASKQSLHAHLDAGNSKPSWIADAIENRARFCSVQGRARTSLGSDGAWLQPGGSSLGGHEDYV